MKEVFLFVAGAVTALCFLKATGTVIHIGSQDLICYLLNNPLK